MGFGLQTKKKVKIGNSTLKLYIFILGLMLYGYRGSKDGFIVFLFCLFFTEVHTVRCTLLVLSTQQ